MREKPNSPPITSHQMRAQRKRVAFGSEEQRSERATSFLQTKKSSQAIRSLRRAGAGNGSRTHLSTLGRSHSTDELYPHRGNSIAHRAGEINRFLTGRKIAAANFRRGEASPVQGEGDRREAVEGLLETKTPLSNSARDEFSVTLKIAITIKIDVTEKLSRNLTSATD